MNRIRISCLVAVTALCAWPPVAPAQTPDACSYDACALRVRYRLFGGQIVLWDPLRGHPRFQRLVRAAHEHAAQEAMADVAATALDQGPGEREMLRPKD